MVTWFDAVKFAEWMSQKTGRHYRLPTEAEYEYAERAGTTSAYYWGNLIGVGKANCFGCGTRWDGNGSSPVGSFPPNKFGLYDMTGNVFEWVADCYYPNHADAPTDASVAREGPNGECKFRTLRASSWLNLPSFLRSAYRFNVPPGDKNSRRGFRLVRE
jgi:formylglycine-generating enzyme required for sulfatase activity